MLLSVLACGEHLNYGHAACEAGGYKVVMPETELRPGVSIGMAEDHNGNWVEFLST